MVLCSDSNEYVDEVFDKCADTLPEVSNRNVMYDVVLWCDVASCDVMRCFVLWVCLCLHACALVCVWMLISAWECMCVCIYLQVFTMERNWGRNSMHFFPLSSFLFPLSSFLFFLFSYHFPLFSYLFPLSSFLFPLSSYLFPLPCFVQEDQDKVFYENLTAEESIEQGTYVLDDIHYLSCVIFL